MKSTIPLRIFPSATPISAARIAELSEIPVAVISDCLHRLTGVVGLYKYHQHSKLAGTALTVKTRPGDNLMIHRALETASEGHILVVDGKGDPTNALVGELVLLYAMKKGIKGFVIDGAIRDVAAFRHYDFPCYAKSVSHLGPFKDGPGEINVPVSVGGQVIKPGDIIMGDDDGIVSFDESQAGEILECAKKLGSNESKIKTAIENGSYTKEWIEKNLERGGYLTTRA